MPRKSKNKSFNHTNHSNSNKLTNGDDIADDDFDSTDESEDSSAELLTHKVEDNIFKTLMKIKNDDPDIYNYDHKFFNDSDFDPDEDDKTNKPEKPFTYSDLVRETLLKDGSEAFENDHPNANSLSYDAEQNLLKKEFLEASKSIDDSEFLTKSDSIDVIPDLIPSRTISDKPLRESELISSYWASQGKLDENEEFLKDYILNQRWREDRLENFKVDHTLQKIDEYDEEHIEKADEFELKYNYRYEEEDGAKIIGYPRNIEDSARKPDERRRQKRLEKKKRKLEEKVRRDEKIKRLKNLRKSTFEKIKEIESTAGVTIKHDAIDFEAPYDPEQHERDMKKIIGLGYDKQDDNYDSDLNPEMWWMCDDCKKGIPSGQTHYDCKECDDFTLCEKCLTVTGHEHKDFDGKKVPIICAPPEEIENYDLDYEDYIGDMPVKFKYRKVEPYPCDINVVLEKSDKELNQMMPLKHLIGYDLPNPNDIKVRKPRKNKEVKMTERKRKQMLKAMTPYNVNRDRLKAFGLDKNFKRHKQ
uniref:KRI1-like family/KRI1-like family C-terminal, putative n=1 Tax=Theileria annulata TaxID=5874 RepID=A0A3B0MYC3_THEAN